MKILIVEDNSTLQLIISKQLSLLVPELKIEMCPDGTSVLATCIAFLPDIILMDCSIPSPDGIICTRLIRIWEKNHFLKRAVIIGMSGHDIEKTCLDAGMDSYMQKPVSLDDLLGEIQKYMN